jgi:hypothetical protein
MRAQEENHMMYDPKLQEILDSTRFLHKWEMKAYIQAIQNRLLDDESILFAYPSNIGFYSLTEKRILFYDKKSGITEMPISSILGIEEKGGKIIFKSSVDEITATVGKTRNAFKLDFQAPHTLARLVRERMA